MPLETGEDRLAFFHPDDGGDQAVITPNDGSPARLVNGIFEDAHVEPSLFEGVSASSVAPRFSCRAQDVIGVERGSTLRVNANDYEISDFEPDGTGMVDVVLHNL